MSERIDLTQQDLEYAFHRGYDFGYQAGERETTLKLQTQQDRARLARLEAELILEKRSAERSP